MKHNPIANTETKPGPERENWAKAFKEMAENGDDTLVMPDIFGDDVIPDWTWNNQE